MSVRFRVDTGPQQSARGWPKP